VRIAFVSILLMIVANLTNAAELPKTKEEEWAYQRGCAGQQAANLCAIYESRVADAELASLYSQESAKLVSFPAALKRLAEAQDAWTKFVEADCHFQMGMGGGSGFPGMYATCVTAHTKRRIEELKEYVGCHHDGCWPK